jgi:hypothetical protein
MAATGTGSGVAPMSLRPGLLLAAIFLCVYGGLALTVDFPKAAFGFQSDEATYYMMGYSLAEDGDLAYRKEDLVRVWREFPSGPSGVFLKRGRTLNGAPDPDPSRYYFGKAFIYPLAAAPFVKVFGTNGFLVLHAILIAVVLLCSFLFLHARARATASVLIAGAFVMASVVPVYFVWIMPELFNFSLALLAFFCWLYKEVADPARSPRGTAWLFTRRSDLACAALLGIDTFSKPTNALLFAAPVAWWLLRSIRGGGLRLITRTVIPTIVVFLLFAGGLFAANMAISGEWNYQGGETRATYYYEFPFQTAVPQRELGQTKSREGVMGSVIFNPRTFASNFAHNLEYFFVGRYTGLLGYFFPAMFAIGAFLAAPRRRPGWQWLVLGAGLLQGVIFIIATPYTWHGGGVGNRYFFSGYGVMLFVLPPIESIAAALVPWVGGGLFVSALVLNPFVASFRPADNAKTGPLRLLPVELTLVNDLPVNTDPNHARLWFGDNGGGDPGFLVYFLDDNAYGREPDKSFWTRGDSMAEFIIKTDRPMRRATFSLTSGPLPVNVTVTIGGHSQDVHLDPNQTKPVTLAMPPGTPFEKEVQALVWLASVSCDSGFTPIFYDAQSNDSRYLGVRVHPELEARPQ